MESCVSPQRRSKCQQPGAGTSMIDGPGLPSTVAVILDDSPLPPSSCPLMMRPWSVGTAVAVDGRGTLLTQRILLVRSGSGGEYSGKPNTSATMLPSLL